MICSEANVCGKKSDYIMIASLILIPLCCLRTLKFISYCSVFASISIVFASNYLIYLTIYSNCDSIRQCLKRETESWVTLKSEPFLSYQVTYVFRNCSICIWRKRCNLKYTQINESPRIIWYNTQSFDGHYRFCGCICWHNRIHCKS